MAEEAVVGKGVIELEAILAKYEKVAAEAKDTATLMNAFKGFIKDLEKWEKGEEKAIKAVLAFCKAQLKEAENLAKVSPEAAREVLSSALKSAIEAMRAVV